MIKIKKHLSVNKVLCLITAISLIFSSVSIVNVVNNNKKMDKLYVMDGSKGDQSIYYLNERDINSISRQVESNLTDYFQKEFDEKSLSLSKNNTDMVKSIGADIQGELANLAVTDNYITKGELDSIINGIVTKVTVDYKLTDENKTEILNIASTASSAGLEEIKSTIAQLGDTVDTVDASTQENALLIGDVKSDATDALKLSSSNAEEITNLKSALANLESENLNNLTEVRNEIVTLEKVDLTSKEGLDSAVANITSLKSNLENTKEYLSEQTTQSIDELIAKLEENVNLLNDSISTSNGSLTGQISQLTATVTTQIIELEKVQSNNLDALALDLQTQINDLDLIQEENKESVTNKINEIDSTLEELHTNDAISENKYQELSASLEEINTSLTNSDGNLSDSIIALSKNLSSQIAELEKNQTSNLNTLASDLKSQIDNLDLEQTKDVTDLSSKIDLINQELENLHTNDAVSDAKFEEMSTAISNLKSYTDGELLNLAATIEDTKKMIEATNSNIDAQITTLSTDLSASINDVESRMENLENTMLTTMYDRIYPVGSIYFSVDGKDPATLFGGTWVQWGSGKVPVGVDTSQDDYNIAESTGGNDTSVLSVENLPEHSHTYNASGTPTGTVISNTSISAAGEHSHTYSWTGAPSAGASTSVWVGDNNDLTASFNNAVPDEKNSGGLQASGRASTLVTPYNNTYGGKYEMGYNFADGIYFNFNHGHSAGASTNVWVNSFTVSGTTSNSGSHSHSASTTSTFNGNKLSISGTTSKVGNGAAIDNRQSYITCYMWKRIS